MIKLIISLTKIKQKDQDESYISIPHFTILKKKGKKLLDLVRLNFQKNNKFKKILYKNLFIISYSFLLKIKNIINSHNKKITEAKIKTKKRVIAEVR